MNVWLLFNLYIVSIAWGCEGGKSWYPGESEEEWITGRKKEEEAHWGRAWAQWCARGKGTGGREVAGKTGQTVTTETSFHPVISCQLPAIHQAICYKHCTIPDSVWISKVCQQSNQVQSSSECEISSTTIPSLGCSNREERETKQSGRTRQSSETSCSIQVNSSTDFSMLYTTDTPRCNNTLLFIFLLPYLFAHFVLIRGLYSQHWPSLCCVMLSSLLTHTDSIMCLCTRDIEVIFIHNLKQCDYEV